MNTPQVFRKGDPCPGLHVRAVEDREHRIWPRVADTKAWFCTGGDEWDWEYVLTFEPLVAVGPVDYDAAVAADERRREEM